LSQPDADPDQLVREALEKFLSRNSIRGDLVPISVPGQSGLARFVKLPPVEERKSPTSSGSRPSSSSLFRLTKWYGTTRKSSPGK